MLGAHQGGFLQAPKGNNNMRPKIFKVQDTHNKSKVHCYKFYACGHVYYNQEISGVIHYSSWCRLYLSYYPSNGYYKYYIQAKAQYDSWRSELQHELTRQGLLIEKLRSDVNFFFRKFTQEKRRRKALMAQIKSLKNREQIKTERSVYRNI